MKEDVLTPNQIHVDLNFFFSENKTGKTKKIYMLSSQTTLDTLYDFANSERNAKIIGRTGSILNVLKVSPCVTKNLSNKVLHRSGKKGSTRVGMSSTFHPQIGPRPPS